MSRLSNLKSVRNGKAWLVWLFLAIFLARFVARSVFLIGDVPSESMQDTMMVGDKFFCINYYFMDDIKNGDIVVFYPNEKEQSLAEGYWVKRVIGIPGDKINIENGIISVNGIEQNEEYVHHQASYTCSFTVPSGKYFVCGDNRSDSWDARKWENPFISKEQIKYKALFRLIPISKFGNIYKEHSIPIGEKSNE